ncbi:hypothetical protein [Parendozoicomonas sp. Alg238-R29]|uniref:hypothetical protein n=1 Tax=Parendozoicomonas sp. Alg238-R29 TaxID=2993446 RepID=UPI00248DA9BB|nr:hypothetical protein [Parendozoicomonas sp. Alg238-R29]
MQELIRQSMDAHRRQRPAPELPQASGSSAPSPKRKLSEFTVNTTECTSWIRFPQDNSAGRRILTHTIVTPRKIEKLETDFCFQEIFPDNEMGEYFARAITVAAKQGVRIKLKKKDNSKKEFIFNPDLPAIIPKQETVPEGHWENLREQLKLYDIPMDDDS